MKFLFKHGWLPLVLFLIAMPVFATGASDLSDLLNQMKTMRASFTQTVFDSNGGKGQMKSQGRMALNRPGKFRWEVTRPMPQVIIANGNRLWIYDSDLQQVTIRSLKTEAGEAPALLLSHQNTTLENDYNITVQDNQKLLRWFVLLPKKKDNMFKQVKMGFDEKRQLQEMVLEDQIGHATRVQFAKIEMNVSLPASLFNFKAPAGTDVIDETKKSA